MSFRYYKLPMSQWASSMEDHYSFRTALAVWDREIPTPWAGFPLPPIFVLIKRKKRLLMKLRGCSRCWDGPHWGPEVSIYRSPAPSSCCCSQELLYRDGVLQRVLDLGLAQEDVPAAHAPQHPLERGNALAVNHASHEPARGQHSLRGCTWATPEPHTLHTKSCKNLVLTSKMEGPLNTLR